MTTKSTSPDVARRGGFQPGNTLGAKNKGNAKGHKIQRIITQALISQLNEFVASPEAKTAAQKKTLATRAHWLAELMIKQAMAGDTTCMKMILDRVEGAITQIVPMRPEDYDPEVQAENAQRHNYTREELAKMTPNELSRLYRESLLEDQRAQGTA